MATLVYCTGLHNIISQIDKETMTVKFLDKKDRTQSVVFVEADGDDGDFGHPFVDGTTWIIARGHIFGAPKMSKTYLDSIDVTTDTSGEVTVNDSVETILAKLVTDMNRVLSTDRATLNPSLLKVSDASLKTPHEGHLYFDSNTKILYIHDGTEYVDVSHYTEIVEAMREIIEEYVGEDASADDNEAQAMWEDLG